MKRMILTGSVAAASVAVALLATGGPSVAATPPTTTVTVNANGALVFKPSSFTLKYASANGCNVSIKNATTQAIALTYGTPGAWKRLPFGGIAAGATGGVGVGVSGYTGYFSAMGAANYVTIHCV